MGLQHFCTIWEEAGVPPLSRKEDPCRPSSQVPTRPWEQEPREGQWTAPAWRGARVTCSRKDARVMLG